MLFKLIFKIKLLFKNYPKLHGALAFLERYFGKWLGCTFAIATFFLALQIFKFYGRWRTDPSFCSQCFKVWVINLSWQLLTIVLSTKCIYLMAIGFSFSGFLPYESLLKKRAQYSQLQSLRTIRPGDVITFNLYMPFSFHDAVVVDWKLQWTVGNMRKLTKPFSTMSEDEVIELLASLINGFLRDKKKWPAEYLDIYVQDKSGQGGATAVESIPYQKIDEFFNVPRWHFKKENGRWKRLHCSKKDRNVPKVLVLADEKHIKLYHDLQIYRVEIVHYDLENGLRFPDVIFDSARVVKLETTTLSIGTKHSVYKKNIVESAAYRNEPEVIIQKALDKIGERNWALFGKWSSDLATECVVVDLEKYYHRGFRFARLVQSQSFDLLYAETLRGSHDSGLECISYLLNLLIKFPRG